MHALQGIVDLAVGIHLQRVVHHVALQERREVVQAGGSLELGPADRRRPVPRGQQFDVLAIVQGLLREALPLDQVHQVHHHVGDAFPLLADIVEPRRADQGVAGHVLVEVMHAFLGDGGFLQAPLPLLAVEGRNHRKFALQDRGDLEALGHDVVQQHAFLPGGVEAFLQQGEMRLVNRHRLVGQHVDAGFQGPCDVLRLLGVVAGGHHHVPFLLREHPVQEILPAVDDLVPVRRIFGAGVVGLDLGEVLLQVLSLRRIDIHVAGDPGVLDLLDEGRVEVARIQGQQDDLLAGRAGGHGQRKQQECRQSFHLLTLYNRHRRARRCRPGRYRLHAPAHGSAASLSLPCSCGFLGRSPATTSASAT